MTLSNINFNNYSQTQIQSLVSKLRQEFHGSIIAVITTDKIPNHPYTLIRVEHNGVTRVGSIGEWDRAINR
jgi:hypothetical protein